MRYIESTMHPKSRLAGAASRRDSRRGRRSYTKIFIGIGILLLLAGLSSGLANAVEYQAFAPVLKVEPIVETRYEPVTREVCTEPDESAREFNKVAATIGEDIRRQMRLWQQQHRCRNVTEQRARERVVGYRVTYRYGGETATTRLSYDPGERMPVNVSLSPLK
jgi:uncharacterized protein YcfJ